MSEKKQDDQAFGLAVFAVLVSLMAVGVGICSIALKAAPAKPCQCQPAPTPAACCKADDCRKELAQVDARFGDVWDELVEVQEQLAKVKPCGCEPSKPCACSAKPACECKPAANPQLPTKRVLKRCK